MLKIGIIGTDGGYKSGHSSLICKMISSGLYSAEVSAIMGNNKTETEEIAELCKNHPYIAKSVEELLDRCDAVMILYRDGKYHTEPAIKALNARKAVFVDKPLAVTVEDGEKIIDAARKNHAILCSGSNLYYIPALDDIKNEVNNRDDITSVYISYPLIDYPEYGGLHFYSHHILTEYLAVFNQEIKSIFATTSGGNIAIIADNGSFPIFLNCSVGLGSLQYGVYFKNGTNIFKEINCKNELKAQLENFLSLSKNKSIHDNYEQQLLPVKLSCAILESLKTGLKVDI